MKTAMSITRFLKSKSGQSVVEFTLAAPLFFAAFYAIVEFSHLFYVRVTVQHALDEAGRYSSTGQGQDADKPDARLAAIKDRFCKNLTATGLSCSSLSFAVSHTTSDGGSASGPGGPDDIVTVSTTFAKPLFSGALRLLAPLFPTSVNMTLSTVYKNEPYVVVPSGGGSGGAS